MSKHFVELTTKPKLSQNVEPPPIVENTKSNNNNNNNNNNNTISSETSTNFPKEKPKKTSLQQASVSQSLITPKPKTQQLPQYSSASTMSKHSYSNEQKTNENEKYNYKSDNNIGKQPFDRHNGSPKNLDENNVNNKRTSPKKASNTSADLTNTNYYAHPTNPINSNVSQSQPTAFTNINYSLPYSGPTVPIYPTIGPSQGQYYPNQMQSPYNPYMMPYPYSQQQQQSQHQQQNNFQYFY